MTHVTPASETLPEAALLPAWRAACIAYHRERRAGTWERHAHDAACEAVLALRPDMTPRAASDEAIRAIAYASQLHPRWLWDGVGAGSQP